jgi:hypothetical protein
MIEDWIVLNTAGASETVLLKPTPGAWDSRHVCDPCAVRGEFSMGGIKYTLALFYTGTQDVHSNGCGNRVGVAFANDIRGPWVKRPDPLVERMPGETDVTWGVGQPSATKITDGRVLLAFTRGDFGAEPTRMCAVDVDLTDAQAPVIMKSEWALPRGGFPAGLPLYNGDVAYCPQEKRVYLVHNGPMTSAPTAHLPDTVFLRSISEHEYWAGAGSWTLHGSIGPDATGWPKNHDAGLVKTLYGTLPSPPQDGVRVSASVSESIGWPDALFSYRVVEATVSLVAIKAAGAAGM